MVVSVVPPLGRCWGNKTTFPCIIINCNSKEGHHLLDRIYGMARMEPKLLRFELLKPRQQRAQMRVEGRRRMAQVKARALPTSNFVLQPLHASSRDQLYMGTICFILLASLCSNYAVQLLPPGLNP
jgi:hypothetical protein